MPARENNPLKFWPNPWPIPQQKQAYQINETINTETTSGGRFQSRLLSASTLDGDDVYNLKGEKLGNIKELMRDIENGKGRHLQTDWHRYVTKR